MKVNKPSSWFVAGDGKVKANFNRLELSELSGNDVVLKFHWIEGLTATPSTAIEPLKIADDPIPFINSSIRRPKSYCESRANLRLPD